MFFYSANAFGTIDEEPNANGRSVQRPPSSRSKGSYIQQTESERNVALSSSLPPASTHSQEQQPPAQQQHTIQVINSHIIKTKRSREKEEIG